MPRDLETHTRSTVFPEIDATGKTHDTCGLFGGGACFGGLL
jgi:hypothetical protein